MAKVFEVGVKFEDEDAALIKAVAIERDWSHAKVVRWGFLLAVKHGLVKMAAPARPSPDAAPPPVKSTETAKSRR